MIILIITIMVVCLILGFPFFVGLIAAPIAIFQFYLPSISKTIMIQQTVAGVTPLILIAVPMFIFAADIMMAGQSANRLLNFVSSFIRHIKGGLPIVTCSSCTLFGAISGSTMSTVCAIGGPMRPKLIKAGYPSSFSTALIINASDIALLIPPSLGMIFYGVVTGTSVGALFLAGVGPGLLILFMFSIYCYFYSKRKGIPAPKRASWGERLQATRGAVLPLGFPLIIIGGIYSGIFSPTEAAAVSVLYALILEVLIFRSIHIKNIPSIALSSAIITAVVLILVGFGIALSWVISFVKIPNIVLPALFSNNPGSIKILLTISIIFFVGCMFMDPIVVIVICSPILHPIAVKAGINPVLVGTIVTLQAAIGSATPPFGCDIFTAMTYFRRPYFEVIKGTPPFIFILMMVNALLIFYPEIALYLPDFALK